MFRSVRSPTKLILSGHRPPSFRRRRRRAATPGGQGERRAEPQRADAQLKLNMHPVFIKDNVFLSAATSSFNPNDELFSWKFTKPTKFLVCDQI